MPELAQQQATHETQNLRAEIAEAVRAADEQSKREVETFIKEQERLWDIKNKANKRRALLAWLRWR